MAGKDAVIVKSEQAVKGTLLTFIDIGTQGKPLSIRRHGATPSTNMVSR